MSNLCLRATSLWLGRKLTKVVWSQEREVPVTLQLWPRRDLFWLKRTSTWTDSRTSAVCLLTKCCGRKLWIENQWSQIRRAVSNGWENWCWLSPSKTDWLFPLSLWRHPIAFLNQVSYRGSFNLYALNFLSTEYVLCKMSKRRSCSHIETS